MTGTPAPERALVVPRSEPYPWPFDGGVAASRTALLVIGAQPALMAACTGGPAMLEVVAALASATRQWGATVIRTRHAASPAQRRPGFLPAAGTAPWKLLDDAGGDTVVDAFGIDGFAGSPLAARLVGSGIDHVLMCGMGLEGPVHSTMRSANDRGFECLLVTDGCAAFDPDLADPAVRTIEMSGGIFGAVATAGDVLSGLGAATARPMPSHA